MNSTVYEQAIAKATNVRIYDPEQERKTCSGFLDLPRRDIEKYSVLRAIAGMRDAIMRNACGVAGLSLGGHFDGLEAECHRRLADRLGHPTHGGQILIPSEIAYRDLSVSVAGAGGYLAGTATGRSFIDVLRNRSVAFRMGARRAPGQIENLTLPKKTGAANVAWQTTEGTTVSESTPTFVQISASPKTCGAYIEISEKLLKQITPATEALLNTSLASDVAVGGVDLAAIAGSGAAGQPTGVINTAGIGSVSGSSLGYAGLVECQTDVADANAVLDPSGLGYVTTPAVASTLKGRQRFTGTDSPLWRGAIHEGEIEGVTAMSSKQVPAATLIYGDWSSLIVAEWGVLVVEVNPFTDFKAGIVGVRALWSVDVIVEHPGSFTVVSSIT